MRLQIPDYLIVGERPVQVTPTDEGGFDVLGYEWETGGYIRDLHSWESLFDGGIDARPVDESAYRQHVENLRRQPAAASDSAAWMLENRLVNIINCRDQQEMLEREAVERKAVIEYRGDVSRITNIACSSLVFDSVEALQAARSRIVGEGKLGESVVVRVRDRFEHPLIDGWRDVLIHARSASGVNAELQLGLKAFGAVRRKRQNLYAKQDALNQRRLVEDRAFTAAEAQRIMELLELQNRMYEEALQPKPSWLHRILHS